MTTATDQPAKRAMQTAPIEAIEEVDGHQVRGDHPSYKGLKTSIATLGILDPVKVREGKGGKLELVDGHNRLRAARELGISDIPFELTHENASTASTVSNVVKANFNPLEEALAMEQMLASGLTEKGAAQALGWTKRRVTERQKILALPEKIRLLFGNPEVPVGCAAPLGEIAAKAPRIAAFVARTLAKDIEQARRFAREPGHWLTRATGQINAEGLPLWPEGARVDIDELKRVGLKDKDLLDRAGAIDGAKYRDWVYLTFTGEDADAAVAAGVAIELPRAERDRHKVRFVADKEWLCAHASVIVERAERDRDRDNKVRAATRGRATANDGQYGGAQTREQRITRITREHDGRMREVCPGANLDLGARLLNGLATVNPNDRDVAIFFAHGLLGSKHDGNDYTDTGKRAVGLAVSGLRLVIDEHRTVETPTLKSGKPGKPKTTFADKEAVEKWLWRFVEGGKTAGEILGRTLVVFAAARYALQAELPRAQRGSEWHARTGNDRADKALERVVKPHLPESVKSLAREMARFNARQLADREIEQEKDTSAERKARQKA